MAAANTTTTDYRDDKVPLPPATTGHPVREQATQGCPRVSAGCVLSEARPGLAEVGAGGDSRRSQ